jgi:hypothetical protein
MPRKKPGMTPEEQSEAFRAKVRELISAGELNPTEAERALDRLTRGAKKPDK